MSNTKHFKKGSEKPSLPDDGVLRLYSMRFCPYAARVHLVLDAKNIPYHTINIDLVEKPEWLFDANPTGKVPCLQLVNKPEAPFAYESLLIAEYLDEAYPNIKLYPSDPLEKLQEKLWIERFSAVATQFHRVSMCTDATEAFVIWKGIQNLLDQFELELKKRGTIYFGGNEQPNILDYAIWPWFQRIEITKELFGPDCEFSGDRFPALLNWYNSLIQKDKAVQKWRVPKDIQIKYCESRRAGAPDYDLLVQ